MDEQLLKSVSRQLRAIKIMLGLFFVVLLLMFVVLGFMAYKVIVFTHDVNTKITNFENTTSQSFNIKNQLCGNKSLISFLDSRSTICK